MKKQLIIIIFLFIAIALQAMSIAVENRKTTPFTTIRSLSSVDIVLEQGDDYSLRVEAPKEYLGHIKTEVHDGILSVSVQGMLSYSGTITVYVQVKELSKVVLNASGDFRVEGILKTAEFSLNVSGSGDFNGQLNSKNVRCNMNSSGDVQLGGITGHFEAKINGSGDLIANNLHLLSAQIGMFGSGDVKLSGDADFLELIQSGSGDFSGRDFELESAVVKKSSSGDASIFAKNSIDLSISGSGDIYLKGNPELKKIYISGSGEIIKIN
jgi:hypothetical protein